MDPVNVSAKFEVRSFSRSWDNRGYPKKFGSPWIRPRSHFSKIFNRRWLRWTLWIFWPNLQFLALSIPEIIGVPKIFVSPWNGYAHANFSPTFFMDFCLDGACTQKIWAVPGYDYAPFFLFSKIFNGLLFGWTLWVYQPNLKSVALPLPEIIAIELLGTANPQSWEEEAVVVGDGTVRKSVGTPIGHP